MKYTNPYFKSVDELYRKERMMKFRANFSRSLTPGKNALTLIKALYIMVIMILILTSIFIAFA